MKKQPKPWRRAAKGVVIISIVFVLSYALIIMVFRTLTRLEYFKVQRVITSEGAADEFAYLKGRSIFKVDLRKESRLIARRSPSFKSVRIIRILPHELYIDFVRRVPVAVVKLSRDCYVDDEGVVLERSPDVPQPGLPVIDGLQAKMFGVQAGRKYAFPELSAALKIIKEVRSDSAGNNFVLSRIDASNCPNLLFFICLPPQAGRNYDTSCGLEVKFGSTSIRQKMDVLRELLIHLKSDLWNIEYIDLRFKEPVIKFKEKAAHA